MATTAAPIVTLGEYARLHIAGLLLPFCTMNVGAVMRVSLLTTGTELLLGDVPDAHLSFIARQLLPLGLRISEQRTVPDGVFIGEALAELFPRSDLLFVTGGLGPTTDDVTREIVSAKLGLDLVHDEKLMETIRERLEKRGIQFTNRIARQAEVPRGATVLPNDNGTAPGFYLKANLNPNISSPTLFVLPGPPRELRPMFQQSVVPILRSIGPAPTVQRRVYRIANMGESVVEKAVGDKLLAIAGIELGYCARPSEVDLRIVGDQQSLERADAIITAALGRSIFSSTDETLEEVLVKLLEQRQQTLAIAESCTGGLLSNRITNVPGASRMFLAGYVVYSNEAKTNLLNVDAELIRQYGAVSEPVARAMAEGARCRAGATLGIATTGIAGPDGGTPEKPVGTVFIALASGDSKTLVRKLFFPNDRETFKQQTAQAAFDLVRRKFMSG